MRLLVVDDEANSRELLQEVLEEAGHEVVQAVDGLDAWRILLREPIRLVITDWRMPRLDGPELIQRIRQANFPVYTYLILLTALSDRANVLTGLEAGADDYLVKPFDLQELVARVRIGERIIALENRLQTTLERLEVLATHDSLTGLLNRQALMERAEVELQRMARNQRPLCLVLLDIDHFKSVNDRHGHLAGDEVLRWVARTLAGHVRPYDHVGRWGGEEFMVVLPETPLPEAVAVGERVREAVAAEPIRLPSGAALTLQISAGVAEAAMKGTPVLEALFQKADEALYDAKATGRNRVSAARAE